MWKCIQCRKKTAVRGDTCPKCGRWNTLEFLGEVAPTEPKDASKARGAKLIDDIRADAIPRVTTGLAQWDLVLSGGAVAGDVVMLSGEPGAGKSSSTLAMAPVIAAGLGGVALYLSAEMDEPKMKEYVLRIGCKRDNLLAYYETMAELAIAELRRIKPKCVVVDSIQMFRTARYAAKTEHAMRWICNEAAEYAKRERASVWVLSQVDKDNWAACPRGVDHLVDTVCYIEPTRLVVDKNRSGAARVAPRQIPGITQ